MKKILMLLAMALFATAQADFLNNPDPNTLWIENGKNITGWTEGLKFTPNAKGGFTVEPVSSNDSTRYVPTDTVNYPWLVAEVTGISSVGEYKDFSFHGSFGMIGNPMKGIYAFKFGKPGEKLAAFRFNLYGLKLDVKYFKLVKRPDYYVEAVKKDDKLKVTVHLAKPAEDVSVRFFDSYTMPQLKVGGENKLQLLPVDEENPVEWTAEVAAPTQKVNGKLLMQATILGGEVTVPVWGMLQ